MHRPNRPPDTRRVPVTALRATFPVIASYFPVIASHYPRHCEPKGRGNPPTRSRLTTLDCHVTWRFLAMTVVGEPVERPSASPARNVHARPQPHSPPNPQMSLRAQRARQSTYSESPDNTGLPRHLAVPRNDEVLMSAEWVQPTPSSAPTKTSCAPATPFTTQPANVIVSPKGVAIHVLGVA